MHTIDTLLDSAIGFLLLGLYIVIMIGIATCVYFQLEYNLVDNIIDAIIWSIKIFGFGYIYIIIATGFIIHKIKLKKK